MLSLLPTELHQYSVHDMLRGLAAAKQTGAMLDPISLPGLGNAISIRSARAAIIVAIKALGLRAGSRIGVPLYCCPVVFKAIKVADCQPRFLDVDPETFCLSSKNLQAKHSEIDAIIAVHMFGNLCDMPMILETMSGKPVIEDCAQSIGSRLDGRASGSFGDVSLFSFRSGKYLSVGEGAALFARNRDLRDKIFDLVAALPAPSRAEELKHIATTYIRAKLRGRVLWGSLGSLVWAIYNKKTEFAKQSPIIMGQMFRSDLAAVHKRMPQLESRIALQRAHAEYYERHLQLDYRMLCHEKPRAYYNRFMYPIVFPSTERRDAIAAFLRRQGIGTSHPYEDVIAGAKKHYGYDGDCPVAEKLLKQTLVVPGYHKLKTRDVEHIARSLNQGYLGIGEDRGLPA